MWQKLMIVLLGVSGLILSNDGRAQNYNSLEGLCTAFSGRIIAERRGSPILADCNMIRIILEDARKNETETPGAPTLRELSRNGHRTWEQIINDPNEENMRRACQRELISDSEISYLCAMKIPVRFTLDRNGLIGRVDFSIDSQSDIIRGAMQRAGVNSDLSFTSDGNRLILYINFLIWSERSAGGEYYIESGDIIHVSVYNPHSR
jgi:hypothetical protein